MPGAVWTTSSQHLQLEIDSMVCRTSFDAQRLAPQCNPGAFARLNYGRQSLSTAARSVRLDANSISRCKGDFALERSSLRVGHMNVIRPADRPLVRESRFPEEPVEAAPMRALALSKREHFFKVFRDLVFICNLLTRSESCTKVRQVPDFDNLRRLPVFGTVAKACPSVSRQHCAGSGGL